MAKSKKPNPKPESTSTSSKQVERIHPSEVPRVTVRVVEQTKLAIAKNFGIVVTPAQARLVVGLDTSLIAELSDSGEIDSLPRGDLGSAILAAFMPGPPTVQDKMWARRRNYWCWPCYGSDAKYRREFVKAFREAMGKNGIRFTDE